MGKGREKNANVRGGDGSGKGVEEREMDPNCHLTLGLFMSLFFCLSFLPVNQSVCLFMCLYICVSVYLSVYLFI